MANATLDKTTIGFGLSAAVVSILSMLLTVWKEETPSVLAAMARATGHHWTTHGVIIIALFIVLGFVFSGMVKPESWTTGKLGNTILWSVIIAGVGLAAFMLLH